MTSAWTAADYALAARDWSRVPAGEEMDRALIQLNVEGPPDLALRPSRDFLAAWVFLRLLLDPEQTLPDHLATAMTLRYHGTHPALNYRWRCELAGADWESEGSGDTPELAICRALLDYGRQG